MDNDPTTTFMANLTLYLIGLGCVQAAVKHLRRRPKKNRLRLQIYVKLKCLVMLFLF